MRYGFMFVAGLCYLVSCSLEFGSIFGVSALVLLVPYQIYDLYILFEDLQGTELSLANSPVFVGTNLYVLGWIGRKSYTVHIRLWS